MKRAFPCSPLLARSRASLRGVTLLEALQQRFPESSKTTLRQMLANGRVCVNGVVERKASRAVAPEDRVEVGSKFGGLDPRITILYQDDDLVVIDKAAGLLTVATSEERGENAEAILTDFYRGRAVHVVQRLDRDTSGILVFARNADMRDRLQQLFASHDIERVYVAIVHGRLTHGSGTFRSFLAEDASRRVHSVADERQGKEAITHYRKIASGARFSKIEATLETGRRNQIRVHFSEAGHPVVGDKFYAPALADPLGRLALHAAHLGFVHPRTKKKVSFDSPVPAEFETVEL